MEDASKPSENKEAPATEEGGQGANKETGDAEMTNEEGENK